MYWISQGAGITHGEGVPRDSGNNEDEGLLEKIKEAYKMSRRTYGSPRVTKELREKGVLCGENRIARLMRLHGIYAKTKRRFKVTTHSNHHLPVAANLLKGRFQTDKTNKVLAL
jgi:transposase InsO family protein